MSLRQNLQKTNIQLIIVVIITVVWRIGLFVVGVIAQWLFDYQPSFPYAFSKLPLYSLPQWVYSWAGFDGVHYITIAEQGYVGTGLIQAFFPGYPLVVMLVNPLFHNIVITGLVASTVCLMIFLCLLFVLVKETFSTRVAWFSIGAILVFPTSFFFGAVYSESLFLSLVIASFLAAKHDRWWLAGIFAALASYTRLVGIFLVPALLWQSLDVSMLMIKSLQTKKSFASISIATFFSLLWQVVIHYPRKVIAPLLGLIGLALYSVFLFQEYQDPLYFLHVQAEFGAGRQETLVIPLQSMWRYIKIILTVEPSWKWWSYVQDLLMTLFALIVLLWIWLKEKKFAHSWLIFSCLAILLPTTTGTLSSMPRYILVAFPIYIWLGLIINRHPKWQFIWIISGIILIINTCLFIQGCWIA